MSGGNDRDCVNAVMFARIAALSAPDMPPGLAERIVRNVPRLAQMPAPYTPLRGRSLRLAVHVRAAAQAPVRPAVARRRLATGWTAFAAGLAALALMLPTEFRERAPVHAPRQVALTAVVPARVPASIVIASAMPARLRADHPVRTRRAPAVLPEVPDSGAAAPIVAETAAPVEIAASAPGPARPISGPISGPVYGPVDTEAGSRGVLPGPVGMTQGFAYTSAGAHPR